MTDTGGLCSLKDLTAKTIGGVWGSDPGEDEVDVPVYRQTEFDDHGRLLQPAGAVRSITARQLETRTLEPGDVLIQKSAGTPTLPGRVVEVPPLPETSTFSNFLNLLRPDKSRVEPRFYFLLLQHLHKTGAAFEFQRGTNIRNLDLKSYLDTTVACPALPIQRRIVDLVGSIDTCIDSLEAQIDTTRVVRAGVSLELLSDPDEDWQDSTLGEAAEIKQGETIAVKALAGGPHPVFGANGIVGWHDRGNVTEETVALGCRGSCGTVHIAPAGSFLANNVMGVRAIDGKTVVGFLAVMLEFADLRGSGVISGQVQEQITRKSLAPLPVLLPPLREQHRIVDLIASFGEHISSLELQVQSVRALRSGLLSELLSGDRLLDESYDMAVGL